MREFFSETKNKIMVGFIFLFIIITAIILAVSNKSTARKKAATSVINQEATYNGEMQQIGVLGAKSGYPAEITLDYSGDLVVEIENTNSLFYALLQDQEAYLTVGVLKGEKEVEGKQDKIPYQQFIISFHDWYNQNSTKESKIKKLMGGVGSGAYVDTYTVSENDANEVYVSGGVVKNDLNLQLPQETKVSLISEEIGYRYDFQVRIDENGNLAFLSASENVMEKERKLDEKYAKDNEELKKTYAQFKAPSDLVIVRVRKEVFDDREEESFEGFSVYAQAKDGNISEVFVTDEANEADMIAYYEKHFKVSSSQIAKAKVTCIEDDKNMYYAVVADQGMALRFGPFESEKDMKSAVKKWCED